MKTKESANKLINNPVLKAKSLTVYIPTFRTTSELDKALFEMCLLT